VIHTRGESFDAREGAAAIAVEPDSAVVTIPDAHFLFTADFKRKGSDLVLTGEDGRKILVPDYFPQEKQSDLVSPEGAEAAALDTTADTSSDDQSTATADGSAGTDPTSNLATNALPATGDFPGNGTQAGAMAQTAPTAGLAGRDTFVFAANFGNVTLSNFDPGTDEIEIDHTVFADFQELLAAAHDDGSGNAVITADPNDTITIKNVTVAQLVQHQGDFHFT
jgi:hypothetical protein